MTLLDLSNSVTVVSQSSAAIRNLYHELASENFEENPKLTRIVSFHACFRFVMDEGLFIRKLVPLIALIAIAVVKPRFAMRTPLDPYL